MLKSIHIKNFKCFSDLYVETSYLNVFAGVNSMGKSTVIQSLLLLRQSYDLGSIDKGIHLDGQITNIGIGSDLLNRFSDEEKIVIELKSEKNRYYWCVEYNGSSDYQKLSSSENIDKAKHELNLFNERFSYISAERVGPKRAYEKSYYQVVDKDQLGYAGELSIDYLVEHGHEMKISNKCALHQSQESSLLIYQVQGWLGEISPGINLNPKEYKDAGLVGIEYSSYGEKHSPLNVGFGLSYVLPVIIALLKARAGDIVVLENPEAHLHPRGQRKMGELIARVSSGGVQVILETHSDHILNGIRLSVKKRVISSNLIRLNYMFRDYIQSKPVYKKSSPKILDDGSLSAWPDGFFDEWDKAIDDLF